MHNEMMLVVEWTLLRGRYGKDGRAREVWKYHAY